MTTETWTIVGPFYLARIMPPGWGWWHNAGMVLFLHRSGLHFEIPMTALTAFDYPDVWGHVAFKMQTAAESGATGLHIVRALGFTQKTNRIDQSDVLVYAEREARFELEAAP